MGRIASQRLESKFMSEEASRNLSEELSNSYEPLALREWTAREFADIYVRFYPHVLRQAKKFLTNHSQAEEVTQDAFLYLMTSLPEVDSEIGVLKLLKWKTRLLALDVIKASGGVQYAPLDEQTELSTGDMELSAQLERADDAAIVALALAKLDPRQREALVASLYEERTTLEVATHLGITENATKQLVFRAKASFKKALVGEAEINGLSVSGILSVAARKAAKESGKYISAASALVLVLAISWGFIPNSGDNETPIAAFAPTRPAPAVSSSPPLESAQSEELLDEQTLDESIPDTAVAAMEQQTMASEVSQEESSGAGLLEAESEQQFESEASEDQLSPSIRLASLAPYLELSVPQAQILREGTAFFPQSPNVLKVHSGVGLWAYVDLDPETFGINAVGFEIMIDGERHFGSARSFGTSTTKSTFGYTVTYSATELFLINEDGVVLSDQELASAFVTISIQLSELGDPLSANLFINS